VTQRVDLERTDGPGAGGNVPGSADGVGGQVSLEMAQQVGAKIAAAISTVVLGKPEVIRLAIIAVLAEGHLLIEDVPGTGKTVLAKSLARTVDSTVSRVQFTPDLMPADIIGSEVLEEDGGRRSFRFLKGPVFTQLLMADEINRASPRTQSALLQAMQERQVTVAGVRYDLPQPFHVLATQNPLEQEGTYPLPEAQLDRFLLQIDIGYPDKEAEKRMVLATTFGEEAAPATICTPADLIEAQKVVRFIPVGEKVVDAILRLVRAARPDAEGLKDIRESVSWGPGPRASQAFMLAVRARALIGGRLAPSTDDVVALAQPVLRHRMALSFSARAEGLTVSHVIDRLCRELL
jgi:MoxR-like ATPase